MAVGRHRTPIALAQMLDSGHRAVIYAFDPGKPSQWSRHDPDLVAREGTALRELADKYAERVAGNVASAVVHHRGGAS
jgi:hypothetical protein